MSLVKFWHADAFTDHIFGGNPAAVCWLERNAPDAWMQSIAAELNLPATAFVALHQDDYRLRWFTPKVEIPLRGQFHPPV